MSSGGAQCRNRVHSFTKPCTSCTTPCRSRHHFRQCSERLVGRATPPVVRATPLGLRCTGLKLGDAPASYVNRIGWCLEHRQPCMQHHCGAGNTVGCAHHCCGVQFTLMVRCALHLHGACNTSMVHATPPWCEQHLSGACCKGCYVLHRPLRLVEQH